MIKYLPFELYGRLYKILNFKRVSKNFLPDDFHVRVLCYHDIQPNNLPQFEKQIEFLKKEANIISPEQLKDFFLGRGFLPGVNVFITFDDASVDQYVAAEVLDKHKIKGAFFICPDDIEKQDLIAARPGSRLKPMAWEQIVELHHKGHAIGSHSMTHPILAELQPFEIQVELEKSKKIIEEKIKDKIDFFAFPYGTEKEISDEARLVANKIYDYNFNFISSKNHFANANRHNIYRTGIRPDFSLNHLRAILSGLKDF